MSTTDPLVVGARDVEILIPSSSEKPYHSSSREPENTKMSVEQARAYQASLANKSSTSGPMLTRKLKDQAAMKKRLQSKPDKCRVKFRFTDGTQAISTFDTSEPASALYTFVRTMLIDTEALFKLEIPGDRIKVPENSDELWKDLHFNGSVTVQVIGTVLVKDEFKKQGKDVGQVVAQNDSLPKSAETGHTVDNSKPIVNEGSGSMKKIPKWLQKSLGKK